MALVLLDTATKVRCTRCNNLLAIITPMVCRVTHRGLSVDIYPGSSVTLTCPDCHERRDIALPVRV